MSRLTRDWTVEPTSRDQTLRHAPVQGNINFPCSADHEQDCGGDKGGKRRKCRKERVGSVAANPDNLESNEEAGGGGTRYSGLK